MSINFKVYKAVSEPTVLKKKMERRQKNDLLEIGFVLKIAETN